MRKTEYTFRRSFFHFLKALELRKRKGFSKDMILLFMSGMNEDLIKTIIFDLGGVVLIELPNFWKRIFYDLSNKFDINFSIFESHFEKNKSKIQIGKINLNEFYQEVIKSAEKDKLKSSEITRAHINFYIKHC